jgi:type I restriction enzyme, S subunit
MDWRFMQVKDLKPFVTSGSRGWATYYSDKGAPFIRITNLSRSNIFMEFNDLRLVDVSSGDAEATRTALQDGDVLISITADIGIVGNVTARLAKPAYINQHIALVRFDQTQTNPRFVSYFLASERMQKHFRAQTDSGAKAGMSLTTVQKIQIALPPTIAEQAAIANALSDADALIESIEKLITKKRHLKQGAMQELLTGKRRLPSFRGKWIERSFGNIFEFGGGYSASRDQLSMEGVSYLHYGDIHGSAKSVIDVFAEQVSIPRLDVPLKQVSKCSLLEDGDVVFVDASEDDAGTSKHVVIVNKEGLPFISGLHTIVAKSITNELDHTFRRYCFQTVKIKQQFKFFAVGTKVSGISKSNIAKIVISIPPTKDEQFAIATILSDMDTELVALEQKLTKARQIKRGMMANLLTGKIRLV